MTRYMYLTISQPKRSTLFPYTTLFRSMRMLYSTKVLSYDHAFGLLLNTIETKRIEILGLQEWEGMTKELNTFRDRKSTRLNSSHVSISYAVFCLKKKTNIHNN